jgi:Protein of unknown function (DUF3574)
MNIQKLLHLTVLAFAALSATAAMAENAVAQDSPCPIPGQKPTLVFQMYFGQSVKNRGPVTKKEWNAFLLNTVTPRFPDGFTVHDAYGQWMNTESHSVIREKTKVIVVATADTASAKMNIAQVADTYRTLYKQQSVAIVSNAGCSAF